MRSWMMLTAGALALCLWSGLIAWSLGKSGTPHNTAVPRSGAMVSAAAEPGVPIEALELRPVDGGLLLTGEVPNAVVAAELLSKSRVMYAPLTVQDGLRVRPEAERSAWLAAALAGLPLPMTGVERPEWLVSAEGLRVGGVATDVAVRDAVRAQLAERFPELPHTEQLELAASAGPAEPTPAAPVDSQAVATSTPVETPPAASAGPVSAAVHPRQAEVDVLLAARPVVFASGSTRLKRGAGPDWRALARLLEPGAPQIVVRGHTDNRGSAEGNRQLSAQRAEAVKQALVRAGVPAGRIRVEGVGAAEPIASNAHADGRRRNRRIEIRLSAEAGT